MNWERRAAGCRKKPAKRRNAVGKPQAEQPGFDELGVPRCPVCHAPLIARLDRRGPGFACQCAARRTPRPRAA
jgi:hypothetical protein